MRAPLFAVLQAELSERDEHHLERRASIMAGVYTTGHKSWAVSVDPVIGQYAGR
jgi:hypothetical protein